MEGEIPVLTETFLVSNESCLLTFDGCTLRWRGNSVDVSYIVVMDYVRGSVSCYKKRSKYLLFRKIDHVASDYDSIIIHYAQCQKKNKLRLSCLKILGEAGRLCRWYGILKASLERYASNRPNRYLVFINPFSGRQNGLELYLKKVKPVFNVAKIETREIVTKNQGDFKKVICRGIEGFDSILAVGGDGTVSEIVNCLIKSKIDTSSGNCETEVPRIPIPIGIIPCGSTDCVAFTLNRTRDIETNALYAVIGNRTGFDVCRAVSECGANRFFVSVFTFGYLSDLIRESEKFRWMGPIRYNYAGLITLLRSKEYYGQLDLAPDSKCQNPPKVNVCNKKTDKKSKSLSLCIVPFVPTVEPAEGLQRHYSCSKQKKQCYESSGRKQVGGTLVVRDVNRRKIEVISMNMDEGKRDEEPVVEDEQPKYDGKNTGIEQEGPKNEEEEPKVVIEEPKSEEPESKSEGKDIENVQDESNIEETEAKIDVEEIKTEEEGSDIKNDENKSDYEQFRSEEEYPKSEEEDDTEPMSEEDKKKTAEDDKSCADKANKWLNEDFSSDDDDDEDDELYVPAKPKCEGDAPQCTEPPVQTDVSCIKFENPNIIKGRFFLIACANISCASELTPNGLAPNCCPGDGTMSIVLFQPHSFWDLYKIYIRLTSRDRSYLISDLPCVSTYKAKQVKISVTQSCIDKTNSANCDGELFDGSFVDIQLFEGIIQFYTRRL